jgi:hypothetical protein
MCQIQTSSPLHQVQFTRNPSPPSTDQPVRIHITHHENGSNVDQEAEAIFVGSAVERRQVHYKEVRLVQKKFKCGFLMFETETIFKIIHLRGIGSSVLVDACGF